MPSKVSRSGVTHCGIRLHSQFSNRRSLAANQFSCILDREGAVCNGIVIRPYEATRYYEQRANVSYLQAGGMGSKSRQNTALCCRSGRLSIPTSGRSTDRAVDLIEKRIDLALRLRATCVAHIFGFEALPKVLGLLGVMRLPFSFAMSPGAGWLHDQWGSYEPTLAAPLAC